MGQGRTRHLAFHAPATPPLVDEQDHVQHVALHLLSIPEEQVTHSIPEEHGKMRLGRVVMLVVAALFAILFALALGYIAGYKTGCGHDQDNSTHCYNELEEAKQLIYEEKTESWKDNAKAVSSLGCKPVMTKVCVKALLHQIDSALDIPIFPTHLAVPRCLDAYSFCGSDSVGKVMGRCEVAAKRTQNFRVWRADGKNDPVECEVHLECRCVAVREHNCTDDNIRVEDSGESDGYVDNR